MGDFIERDWRQQHAFGELLETFSSEMRSCCQSLSGNIASARSHIKDENAVKTLDYLDELVQSIMGDLPGVEEFGQKQKVLALRIRDAKEYQWKHR